jgi:hypothetical protein
VDSLSNDNMLIPVSSYREVYDQVNDIRGFIIREYEGVGDPSNHLSRHRLIQNIADLACQSNNSKGLLKKIHVIIQDSVVHDSVLSIS